ncbi:MAG: STAS domain-containing protein [Clostridiales bacterium]|nr:STAS domain-containing protein [Clostridiales bacterium]
MAISIQVTDNAAEKRWDISLAGEVDIATAPSVRERLSAALAEKKQNILIDLTDLDYIDSTGLGVIISVYGGIRADGLSVKLKNPKAGVRKLLSISGFDKSLL